ncbi:hypothetical protein SAMN05443665_104616 [Actinomadura meyerae]|uniref:Uncharacterized protein n=1 Tax=Actinomadura meyerae TaxID=240840 RepID=A0A239NS09_9ACTN|nr:hypothetical protein [Actinomadura meyerae]SNT56899.1 hypothetical protein SAMN05443665_104616 [Actinomadura meyerae]
MAHAEISEVWPRDGRILIKGEVVEPPSAAQGARWRLRLASRPQRDAARPSLGRRVLAKARAKVTRKAPSAPSPSVLTLPAATDGGGFEVEIPLSVFAPRDAPPKQLWDLYLVTVADERDVRLRLGRHLDDMPGKKHIVTFPQQTVEGSAKVAVRPYYTDGDHLAIRCARRDQKER